MAVDPEVSRGQKTKICAPGHDRGEDESLHEEELATVASPTPRVPLRLHSVVAG